MAKYERGILSPPVGKIGNVIGYRRGGQNILQSIGERKGNDTIMNYTRKKVLEVLALQSWALLSQSQRIGWGTFNGPGGNGFEKMKAYREKIVDEKKLRTINGTLFFYDSQIDTEYGEVRFNDEDKLVYYPRDGRKVGTFKTRPKSVQVFSFTTFGTAVSRGTQNIAINEGEGVYTLGGTTNINSGVNIIGYYSGQNATGQRFASLWAIEMGNMW